MRKKRLRNSGYKNNSHVTISDFFIMYPYRYYPHSNTINIPYIPKHEQISNHKYSLTKKEYVLIIKTYFKYLMIYLLNGNTFTIPNFLGVFKMKKYKSRWIHWAEKKTLKNSQSTQNYRSALVWVKDSKCKMPEYLKKFWRYDMGSIYLKLKGIKIRSNFSSVIKFEDV